MKIAIVSSNGENVDLHLGKGYSLYVYDYEDDDLTFIEHTGKLTSTLKANIREVKL